MPLTGNWADISAWSSKPCEVPTVFTYHSKSSTFVLRYFKTPSVVLAGIKPTTFHAADLSALATELTQWWLNVHCILVKRAFSTYNSTK